MYKRVTLIALMVLDSRLIHVLMMSLGVFVRLLRVMLLLWYMMLMGRLLVDVLVLRHILLLRLVLMLMLMLLLVLLLVLMMLLLRFLRWLEFRLRFRCMLCMYFSFWSMVDLRFFSRSLLN